VRHSRRDLSLSVVVILTNCTVAVSLDGFQSRSCTLAGHGMGWMRRYLSREEMRPLANSTRKTWSLSISPFTPGPGHGLAQCYRHSLPPPTIPAKNPGAPHTLTKNITDPMPTSCMNAPPNHHAHLGSSYTPTSDGRNLHHQYGRRSLATPTLHPHQVYIHSNSSDSAYLIGRRTTTQQPTNERRRRRRWQRRWR
jgi:hypothetical protein